MKTGPKTCQATERMPDAMPKNMGTPFDHLASAGGAWLEFYMSQAYEYAFLVQLSFLYPKKTAIDNTLARQMWKHIKRCWYI